MAAPRTAPQAAIAASRRPALQRRVHEPPVWRPCRYDVFATWLSMFFNCSVQPPSFMRNASRRRLPGILSNPDSVSRSSVPPGVFCSLNSTSVGASFE